MSSPSQEHRAKPTTLHAQRPSGGTVGTRRRILVDASTLDTSISPDGTRLATTSGSGEVRVWDLTDRELIHEIQFRFIDPSQVRAQPSRHSRRFGPFPDSGNPRMSPIMPETTD